MRILNILILLLFCSSVLNGQGGAMALAPKKKAEPASNLPTDYWAHFVADDVDGDGNNGNNGNTSSWTDLSGNNRHLDDSGNPTVTYVNNAANGKDALLFTSLGGEALYGYPIAAEYDTLTAFSIVIVAQKQGTGVMPGTEYPQFFLMGDDVSSFEFGYDGDTYTWGGWFDYGSDFHGVDCAADQDDDLITLVITYDYSTDAQYVKTSCGTDASDTYASSYSSMKYNASGSIGAQAGTSAIDYHLFEIQVFDRALSQVEVDAVIADMYTEYGVKHLFEQQISSGTYDVEEHTGATTNAGHMEPGSSDLEINAENASPTAADVQTVGLQFLNVTMEQGITIDSAFVDFVVDQQRTETGGDALIYCEDADNAKTFVGITNGGDNFFLRDSITWTTANTAWANIDGNVAIGTVITTPNFSNAVQEVVNRTGWASGNRLTVVIPKDPSGDIGRAELEAYEGVAASAPTIRIYYHFE